MSETIDVPIGIAAPDFEISHPDGSRLRLSDFRGKPVVLAFFPDDWDPSRSHQIALYNQVLGELAGGGELLQVSSSGAWCEVQLSGADATNFPFLHGLADRHDVAKLYGVEGRQALIVLDQNGVITWQHIAQAGTFPTTADFARALADKPSGLSRRQFLVAAAAASLALTFLPKIARAGPGAATADSVPYTVTLTLNGHRQTVEIDPRTSLLDFLRDRAGLTGTKKGCDHGQCGACTVHVNGRRINSCLMLAAQAEGAQVTTVEGLAHSDTLHPVQAAFIKHDGYQCGYCTSGQVMSAVACIKEGHAGSEAEIKEWMSGNICRCGAYVGICEAVAEANTVMGGRK